MQQQRRNQTRLGLVPDVEDAEVTVEQALAMLLGERIRGEHTARAKTAEEDAPQIADRPGVARLAPRVAADMPPAGEAA